MVTAFGIELERRGGCITSESSAGDGGDKWSADYLCGVTVYPDGTRVATERRLWALRMVAGYEVRLMAGGDEKRCSWVAAGLNSLHRDNASWRPITSQGVAEAAAVVMVLGMMDA